MFEHVFAVFKHHSQKKMLKSCFWGPFSSPFAAAWSAYMAGPALEYRHSYKLSIVPSYFIVKHVYFVFSVDFNSTSAKTHVYHDSTAQYVVSEPKTAQSIRLQRDHVTRATRRTVFLNIHIKAMQLPLH